MKFSIAFLLATSALLSVSSANPPEGEKSWAVLSAIFGPQLEASFENPETLEIARASENIASSQDGYRILCADYEGGLKIADKLRDFSSEEHQPLLVDKDVDAFCFAANSQNLGNIAPGDFAIDFFVLAPLKIHETVYNHVSSLVSGVTATPLAVPAIIAKDDPDFPVPGQDDTDPQDLTIMFNNGASVEGQQMMISHFKVAIENLATYNFSSVSTDTASPNLKTKLTENGLSDNRASSWSFLMAHLQKKFAIGSESNSTADPCSLTGLSIVQEEDAFEIPIAHLPYTEDPITAAACLVYMTSSLSQEPFARLISLTNRPVVLNFRARSIQQSAKVGQYAASNPYSAQGLLGDNQIVAVADTGLDVNSCYFSDSNGQHVDYSTIGNPVYSTSFRKVIQYVAAGDRRDDVGGHGTHATATVVGSIQNGDYARNKYDGVAPNAKVSFMDLAVTGKGLRSQSANNLFLPGYKAGARVHSNSWGSFFRNSNGYYASRELDSFLYNHPEFIAFYAAGNDGKDRTTSMESSSKNAVSVGASETTYGSTNIDYVAYFSSKGPTYDGRIKPDLVAPGHMVESARSNGDGGGSCKVIGKSGTSMATPAVAGVALLVRQFFMDSKFWSGHCNKDYHFCNTFTPSGVLVKAILLHSGQAMTRFNGRPNSSPLDAPPDSTQGYGRVTLSNVLPLSGVYNFDLFVEDLTRITQNSQWTYHAVVGSSSKPLKVTIAWYDAPSQRGSYAKALINDIDLLVVGDDGKSYRGNGGERFDNLNTNEQVYIASPKVQRYAIYVRAGCLPTTGAQKFSIVVTCSGYTTSTKNNDFSSGHIYVRAGGLPTTGSQKFSIVITCSGHTTKP